MQNEMPQFAVMCVKTDFPNHLCKGVRYKVDPTEKNGKEVATYWLHPIEYKWYLIGYFGLDCFDTNPIRKWINERKGISKQLTRQRIEQPKQRQRIETRKRQGE